MEEPTEDIIKKWRSFIALSKWTFAKTYAKKAPHEYTVREKTYSQKAFSEFAQFIRDYGVTRYFWRKPFIYLEIDGWEYWTMGNPINETTVINRARPKNATASN